MLVEIPCTLSLDMRMRALGEVFAGVPRDDTVHRTLDGFITQLQKIVFMRKLVLRWIYSSGG